MKKLLLFILVILLGSCYDFSRLDENVDHKTVKDNHNTALLDSIKNLKMRL